MCYVESYWCSGNPHISYCPSPLVFLFPFWYIALHVCGAQLSRIGLPEFFDCTTLDHNSSLAGFQTLWRMWKLSFLLLASNMLWSMKRKRLSEICFLIWLADSSFRDSEGKNCLHVVFEQCFSEELPDSEKGHQDNWSSAKMVKKLVANLCKK